MKFMADCQSVWYFLALGFPAWGRSTALILCHFWLGPSWLTLSFGCLCLLGLAGCFSWGWEVVRYVFIFFLKRLLQVLRSHAICPFKSVYHLAGTLWSSNWDKQLAVSKLPATFGQPTAQQIICVSLVFSTWGQTCASQEPTNPQFVWSVLNKGENLS